MYGRLGSSRRRRSTGGRRAGRRPQPARRGPCRSRHHRGRRPAAPLHRTRGVGGVHRLVPHRRLRRRAADRGRPHRDVGGGQPRRARGSVPRRRRPAAGAVGRRARRDPAPRQRLAGRRPDPVLRPAAGLRRRPPPGARRAGPRRSPTPGARRAPTPPAAAERLDDDAATGAQVATADVEADPRAVGEARRFLRRTLAGWDVDDDTADSAILCLSEVVTNAVVHTGQPSEVRVLLDERRAHRERPRPGHRLQLPAGPTPTRCGSTAAGSSWSTPWPPAGARRSTTSG